MNRLASFSAYLLISLLFILLQTSLTSPNNLNIFTPDLNLILIIYFALNRDIFGSFYLAVINGLIMDIFSGNMLGLNTLTRLVIYSALLGTSQILIIKNLKSQLLSIFFSTILFWILTYIILKLNSSTTFNISFNLIFVQAIINTVAGIVVIFFLRKINAKL